jgi:hypothetical protein
MKLGILQPGYLPWLGFFEQLYRTDLFVIYDDVMFDKGGWRNRNRIKTSNGLCWLTVPVIKENLLSTAVKDVLINNATDWRKKHFLTLCQNYRRAPCFKEVLPVIEETYQIPWEKLIDLDMFLIRKCMAMMGIEKPLLFSSELEAQGDRNSRLVNICTQLGADIFYEGKAGESYIDNALFLKEGVTVVFQNYRHPVYSQLYGDFIPYLSVVDLLFNYGRKSLDVIISSPTSC